MITDTRRSHAHKGNGIGRDNDGRPRPAGMRTTRGDGREPAAQSINATRTMRGEDREKGGDGPRGWSGFFVRPGLPCARSFRCRRSRPCSSSSPPAGVFRPPPSRTPVFGPPPHHARRLLLPSVHRFLPRFSGRCPSAVLSRFHGLRGALAAVRPGPWRQPAAWLSGGRSRLVPVAAFVGPSVFSSVLRGYRGAGGRRPAWCRRVAGRYSGYQAAWNVPGGAPCRLVGVVACGRDVGAARNAYAKESSWLSGASGTRSSATCRRSIT